MLPTSFSLCKVALRRVVRSRSIFLSYSTSLFNVWHRISTDSSPRSTPTVWIMLLSQTCYDYGAVTFSHSHFWSTDTMRTPPDTVVIQFQIPLLALWNLAAAAAASDPFATLLSVLWTHGLVMTNWSRQADLDSCANSFGFCFFSLCQQILNNEQTRKSHCFLINLALNYPN